MTLISSSQLEQDVIIYVMTTAAFNVCVLGVLAVLAVLVVLVALGVLAVLAVLGVLAVLAVLAVLVVLVVLGVLSVLGVDNFWRARMTHRAVPYSRPQDPCTVDSSVKPNHSRHQSGSELA